MLCSEKRRLPPLLLLLAQAELELVRDEGDELRVRGLALHAGHRVAEVALEDLDRVNCILSCHALS